MVGDKAGRDRVKVKLAGAGHAGSTGRSDSTQFDMLKRNCGEWFNREAERVLLP